MGKPARKRVKTEVGDEHGDQLPPPTQPQQSSSSRNNTSNTTTHSSPAEQTETPLLSTSAGRPAKLEPTNCRICLQPYTEPYSTICGHTFCRECLNGLLRHSGKCPICDETLSSPNPTNMRRPTMIPNFAAAEMVERLSNYALEQSGNLSTSEMLGESHVLHTILRSPRIGLASLQRIHAAVKRRRHQLELSDSQLRTVLLQEFIDQMLEKREAQLARIKSEMERLKQDRASLLPLTLRSSSPGAGGSVAAATHGVVPEPAGGSPTVNDAEEGLSALSNSQILAMDEFVKYRRRLNGHIVNLETLYFGGETSKTGGGTSGAMRDSPPVGACVTPGFEDFSHILQGLSRYSDMRRLATLNYNLENCTPTPSIVSCIEFDRDGELFVVAGVTKKLKLYDYRSVIELAASSTTRHGSSHQQREEASAYYYYPIEQLQCESKISYVSWNRYEKSLLASSDYDGTVQLWDTSVAKNILSYKEHEKRCWTVQFNNVDPALLASGGDDAKVKLWSTTMPESVLDIDAKVNVCCVYFSPSSRNHLVFGSADHGVHLYDIRNASKPMNVFRGHRKAVSYVRYVNDNEVISASTDSNLRLWDVNSGHCLNRLYGHHNEKNFVGLSTDGNHVVCGSENNRFYLYYKRVSEPLMSFDFGTKKVVDGCMSGGRKTATREGEQRDEGYGDGGPDGSAAEVDSTATSLPPHGTTAATTGTSANQSASSDFVSAVCWKKRSEDPIQNTNIVLAANSQGIIHVMEMK